MADIDCKRCGDTGVAYATDGPIDCPCSVRADALIATLRADRLAAEQTAAQRITEWREKAEHRHWMAGGWRRLAEKRVEADNRATSRAIASEAENAEARAELEAVREKTIRECAEVVRKRLHAVKNRSEAGATPLIVAYHEVLELLTAPADEESK